MRLEVGMYVRRIGIFKIETFEDFNDREYKINGVYTNKNDIKKASHNIIDLIEENDYIRIVTSAFYEPVYYSYGKLVIRDDIDISKYTNKFIAEVITHEQMESMSYKVERG